MAEAFVAPGMTVDDVEKAVARATQLINSDDSTVAAGPLAKIDQAITAAGLSASRWEGTDWWWLRDTGDFPTVADTASYVLRTINSNDMPDLYAVQAVYYDDERQLLPMRWSKYRKWYTLLSGDTNTSTPLEYTVTGQAPTLHLKPVPDDAYTLYVDYTKQHSKITNAGSTNAALIVPAEFHWQIYVGGATWLLKHETMDPSSLANCPIFMEGIRLMKEANPMSLDADRELNKFPDAQGGMIPSDYRIYTTDGGVTYTVPPLSI